MMLAVRRSLANLPPPSADIFTLRAPWCPIAARTLTSTLNIDPGLLGVWRMRGLGPHALPPDWTRGRTLAYRIDAALAWLASRRGEPFDPLASWDEWLRTNAGLALPSRDAVRSFVAGWAKDDGPVLDDGAVRFTSAGFEAYLASLGAA